MTDRAFLTGATLSGDGRPLVIMEVPSGANGEAGFAFQIDANTARRIAASIIESADDAEKLAAIKPEGAVN